jgi:hypothetical protein
MGFSSAATCDSDIVFTDGLASGEPGRAGEPIERSDLPCIQARANSHHRFYSSASTSGLLSIPTHRIVSILRLGPPGLIILGGSRTTYYMLSGHLAAPIRRRSHCTGLTEVTWLGIRSLKGLAPHGIIGNQRSESFVVRDRAVAQVRARA